ncbi:MAG: class I SAM-dependent methyltransferase, partial [Deltaproteobacteria bacterium]
MLKRLICLTLILSLLAEQCLAQGVPAADISSGLTVRSFRPPQLCSISFPPGQGQIDFIIDKGDEKTLKEDGVRALAPVLLNYFYTGLSLPDDSLWVNLRPDSDKSIIDPSLEKTDAGRILLEADVQLKKDLAMLTSPQKPEGRQYWTLLYAKAAQLFGASRQEIPTLARPWIVPGEIVLKESPTGVYVYKAVLRVKLEQDRLKDSPTYNFDDPRLKQLNDYAAVLLRQLIIPRLTRQVNSDRSYAALRQVYYSLVLAQWLKKRALAAPGTVPAPIKTRIDSGDLTGLTSRTPWAKEEYYTAYRKSFEKSEYSFSETTNSGSEVSIRTYNSGGIMIAPESDTRFIVTQGKELPSTRNSSRIRTALDGGDPETEKEPARTDEDLPSYISRQDNSQSTGFTAVSYQDIRNLADMIDWETALAKIDQYKYFFVFPIKNPENLLYITGNFDLNSLERDSSLRMRLELRKILERSMQKELGPADNGLVLELLKQIQSRLGGPEGISEPQLLFILLRNTQRNFDAWIKSYGLGTPYIPEENRIGSEDYSHTRLFAYIYYQEIRELHRLLDAEPDKTISVLDLGTGMANVLFSIMQSLTPEERKRVKLFGIDGQERDMNIARKYGKERGYDITFRKVNVERPDWMQQTLLLNGGEKFDLVISNHVLEHLDPANPPDKYVREWLTLGKNLVVSVPMDEPEETFKLSGHQFRFDVGRLDLIGGILRNDGLNVNLQETSKG